MKPKRLNKKLLGFIVVIVIIFLLPLVVIGRTIIQGTVNTVINTTTSGMTGTTAQRTLPPGNDWPMYLYNNGRTANNPETVLSTSNANQLTRLWSFKTGGTIASAAAVVKGVIYFGSWDGYEYALDELTGALKWKTFLGITHAKPICNPPTLGVSSGAEVVNGVVYVGGGDAYWYALDARTGKVLWKINTGDNSAAGGHYNWSSPLIYNGYAYIGIASLGDCPLVQGRLLKVSLTKHNVVDEFNVVGGDQIGGGIWTSPSLDPKTNTIFIATGTQTMQTQPYSQALVSLDATTLQVKDIWKLPAAEAIGDSDFDTSPILFTDAKNDQLIATVNKDGNIFAFNRNNINAGVVWQKTFNIAGTCPVCEFSSVSSSTFGQGMLYAGAGDTDIGSTVYRGSVTAMDPSNGTFLWRAGSVDGAVIGALAYSNGLVVAGMGTELAVLNATTGTRIYTYNMNSFMFAAPVISHGEIYEGSTDGTFYAFGLASDASPNSTTQSCSNGWTCQDIGVPIISGSQNIAGDNISVSGGGDGISTNFDQMHFISKKQSGNLQLTAELASQQLTGTGGTTQVGLMARQDNEANAPYYGAFLTESKGITIQYRNIFGGQTTTDIQLPQAKFPIYLNLQRHGDQFETAYSYDGKTFTLVPGSTADVVMPTTVNLGLAVSSFNQETQVTASFRHVTFGPPYDMILPPAPTSTCPAQWSCTDIGNPAQLGSQSLQNGVWTIKGGGSDIWNAQDQFHYVYQNLGTATAFSARIASFDSTVLNAKAGIMIRQDKTPASAYYGVFVEPAANHTHTISVEVRDSQGVLSRQVAMINTTTVPAYLKIVHTATTISAYSSTDGENWSLINGSTLTLDIQAYTPGTTITLDINSALVGLAVSSHDPDGATTATFDEVAKNA